MVDREVMCETKKVLTEMFDGDTQTMINYLFKGKILDVNKCRIAIIKRHYRRLVQSGINPVRAKQMTAEKFNRSENNINNIIYIEYYKPIFI
jgi:hypothetical protein